MREQIESQISVVDAPDHGRFEIFVDGALAGYTEYHEQGDLRVFPHTVIHEAYGGRGLAKILVRHALDETRAAGRPVLPYCKVVRGFIAKNPDYLDLVPVDRRAEFALA